jgi:uncharacterized protein YkwD
MPDRVAPPRAPRWSADVRDMRTLLTAALTTAALTAALPAAAQAAPAQLLAPAGTCAGDSSATATAAAQVRAMRCLVSATRARAGLPALHAHRTLTRAAQLKGARIQACGSFSHTPCGAPFSAAFAQAGWHGRAAGENIAFGQAAQGTPRAILAAWLASPGHRANLLRAQYRYHGLAVRHATLPGIGTVQLWVHTFGR